MTEINPSESPNKTKNKKKLLPPRLKEIKLFKHYFKSSHQNLNTKEDCSPKKNSHQNEPKKSKKNEPETTILDRTDILQFLPELGTNVIDKINKIIVEISPCIKKAIDTPAIDHVFYIKLIDSKLIIKTKSKEGKKQLSIKCDCKLYALLNHYLPELKKHLRKKSIHFDDYLFEELKESDNQKKKLYYNNIE